MSQFSRILVALRDPAKRAHRALRKAAQLAAGGDVQLELFHAICDPLYSDAVLTGRNSLSDQETAIHQRHLAALERLAAPLRKQGLKVTCTATWDFPAAHAIVRQSLRSRADLIVVDSRPSHSGWFLRFTDWELLRLSPKPVLLIKTPRAYDSPVILAALDPGHGADKPAKLDVEILAAASALLQRLGGTLHAVHAYVPGAAGLRPEQMAREGFAERLETRARSHASRAIDKELKAAGLNKAERHVVALHPVNAIPNTARKTGAAITVMGAISRSGLRRVLIGNTAEQILDDLRCDVLVVKPANFARRVAAETRGPDLRPMTLAPNYV
jgi:universal stress protein E